jgi:hypothetical protein
MRTIATLSLLQVSFGSEAEEIDCPEAKTSYKYFTDAAEYPINNLSIVQTSKNKASRWLGVSGRFSLKKELNVPIILEDFQVTWLYELAAFNGYPYVVVLVLETGTKYRYYPSLPDVPTNGTSVLPTIHGGDSRWIGVEGQYVYSGLNSLFVPSNAMPGDITVVDEITPITSQLRKITFVGANITSTLTAPDEVTVTVSAFPISFAINSFTLNRNNLEIGQAIGPTGVYPDITFNWSYNMVPDTSQTIDHSVGAITPLSALTKVYTPGSNITANTNYTLTAVNASIPYTASAALTFHNKRYWGVSSSADPFGAGINTYALLGTFLDAVSEEFITSRQTTKTFNCTGGKYFFFYFPTSFGTSSPQVQVGAFPVVISYVQTLAFTNQSGHTENYYIYRGDNVYNTSALTVQVL